jgi:hypothetical protein
MSAPTGTAELKVVSVNPDGEDMVRGTIRLVDGALEFSNPDHEVYLRRWRMSGIPDDETFAELLDGGWSNGAIAIRP